MLLMGVRSLQRQKIHFIGATFFHVAHHKIVCTEDLASHSASLVYICCECLVFVELWGHFKCHHLGFSSLVETRRALMIMTITLPCMLNDITSFPLNLRFKID